MKKDLEEISSNANESKDIYSRNDNSFFQFMEHLNEMYKVFIEKAYECSRYITNWLNIRDFSEKEKYVSYSSPYGKVSTNIRIS